MSTDPTAEADPATDPTEDAEATTGAFECPYCGRRFAREPWRDLHRGQEHGERLDAAEREAYEAAREAEAADIRVFRLKALAVLVLVYFGFLMVYAFTL